MKTGLLLIGGVLLIFGYTLVYNGFANLHEGQTNPWFREQGFAKALIPSFAATKAAPPPVHQQTGGGGIGGPKKK